ncbi:MAG: histidine phosphatase family protein [Akkermansiaceae bacterium]|nr:histidine phosphatase family protein [Akkermansiaceae bacterium]
MQLLLLRHGHAEDHPADGTDFSRALVEKGIEQAHNAARVLEAADFLPEIVLSSPVLRARQTAEEFTQAAGLPGPVMQSWLSCGMSPGAALSELAGFPDFGRILIVGHEPDFSQFVQQAIGSAGGTVEIRKGSLTCLEINPPSPRATLLFLFPFMIGKHLKQPAD